MVTVTSTGPNAAATGLTTTIWVAVSLIRVVAAAVPKTIAVTSARFVPVMMTSVPPDDRTAARKDAGHRRRVGEHIGGRGRRRCRSRWSRSHRLPRFRPG